MEIIHRGNRVIRRQPRALDFHAETLKSLVEITAGKLSEITEKI